jgi:hypothetical protein
VFSGSVLIVELFEFTLGYVQSYAFCTSLHIQYTSAANWHLCASGLSACQSGKWTRGI